MKIFVLTLLGLAVALAACKKSSSSSTGGGVPQLPACYVYGTVNGSAKQLSAACVCEYDGALNVGAAGGAGEVLALQIDPNLGQSCSSNSCGNVSYSASSTTYTSVSGGTLSITLTTFAGVDVGDKVGGTYSATDIPEPLNPTNTVDITNGSFACTITSSQTPV